MSNIIKYSGGTSPNSIKSGNFNVGVNSTPTDLTGFYNGISPIIGGYTIYINKTENGPSIYSPKNDSELIDIVQKLGGNISTAEDALVWINSQSNMTVLNNNYPSIVTDGLILNLDAGFVSSYPKTGTTWRDLSGNGNNGTLINGVGFSGGSMVFDGVNDRVTIPDFNYGRQGCTVCAWVKYNASSKGYKEGIVSKWQTGDGQSNEFILTSNDLYETSPKYPIFTIYNTNNQAVSAIDLTTIMTVGTWYYLVGSFDGLNSKIYVNGVFKSSSPNSSSPTIKTLASQPIAIASFGNSFQYNTNCSILSTKIYNRALSDQEILQNYYAGLQRFIPTDGLVLSLDAQNTNLYATSPTTAYDVSGNGNNGTLTNGVGLVGNGGGSWSFDGVDDIIQFPTEYNLPNWTYSVIYGINVYPNVLGYPLLTLQNNTAVISPGLGTFYGLNRIVLDNQNNIYLGTFGNYKYQDITRPYAMKLNNDGSLNDLNFNYTYFAAVSVENFLIKSDNSVGFIAGTNLDTLAKFNTTTGQRTSALGINSNVGNTVLFLDEPNNHVYLGGSFTTINGVSYGRMARFNMDTLVVDSTFNTSNGFDNYVFSAKMNSLGKIYAVGTFTTYKGSSYNRIIRLNNDGTIDTVFNVGTGLNSADSGTKIILDSDEKPIITGIFTSYNGIPCNRIVRLNVDGTIDTTFSFGSGFNYTVSDVAYDSFNKKIYCVGSFTSYNGTNCGRIVRLNMDGTIDSTFNTGTGFSGPMTAIAIQSDYKIIVGVGEINVNRTFTRTYKTTQFSSLIRLNYDGSVDNTFNAGLGFTEGTYRNQLNLLYRNSSGNLATFYAYNNYPGNFNRLNLQYFQDYYNNKFHLMTITKDVDNLWRVYEDGVLRNTLTPPVGSDLSLKFQKITGVGLQTNIQLYNRALSQSEITTIYNATKSRYGIQ